MSYDTIRCGGHDKLMTDVGELKGSMEAMKIEQVAHNVSIEKLHERINNLKACMMEIKIDTIKAVNKNNLKLVAIISPLTGVILILGQHFFK